MATLPKPDFSVPFLTVDELWAIRGTQEFDVEYRRQLAAVAEHDRRTKQASRMELDPDAIKGWE